MAKKSVTKKTAVAKTAAGKSKPRRLGPATTLVHGGTQRSQFGETSEAIFLTRGYVYPSAEAAEARFNGNDPGYVYSRYANPTVSMFEDRMKLLEGAEDARATASGMAAVNTALMALLKAGDHVVAAKALFGSCRYIIEDLLPRFGVKSTLVDGTDLNQWKRAIRKGKTKAVFLESPTNPTLEIVDITAVADLAHAAGAKLVVDNVFATPLFQKPLLLGADVVVYSATKHIDGQGRCLGGVMLGDKEFIEKAHTLLKHTGPSMSPFNAWVLLKGLETLPLRAAKQAASAKQVAEHLAGHARITRTIYPTLESHPQAELAARQMACGSTMVAFEVAGGKAGAFKVAGALEVIRISNNLGDAKSLICHPSTTTHQRLNEPARLELGITQGLLRLSVGLEDVEDLIDDLDRALATLS